MHDGMFWGMHFIWWAFFVLIFVLLLVWMFAVRNPFITPRSRKESPLDVLKNRFARGEITKEEYEDHRRILEQS
jgi:putative membrane protein